MASIRLSTMLLVALCTGVGSATALGAEPERQIEVEIRTIGWGVQIPNLHAGRGRTSLHVLNSQISNPFIYRGPQTLEIWRGNPPALQESDLLDDESESLLWRQTPQGEEQPIAVISGLKNRQKILLFFFPNEQPTANQPYRVLVFDDSLINRNQEGIIFYNLCGRELAVKMLDRVKSIPSGSFEQWNVAVGGEQSTVAVAVTSPEAKVVYASRFRLSDRQRMFFVALPDSEQKKDAVRVTSFLETVGVIQYGGDL